MADGWPDGRNGKCFGLPKRISNKYCSGLTDANQSSSTTTTTTVDLILSWGKTRNVLIKNRWVVFLKKESLHISPPFITWSVADC